MKIITIRDFQMHGTYTKESDNLTWTQYYHYTNRVWYLFNVIPIWTGTVHREDRSMQELIRKAFGE